MSEFQNNQLIYHYSADDGEYLSSSEAQRDPVDTDNWLVPALATLTPPPQTDPKDGHAFAYQQDKWIEVVDNRGQAYYLPDGSHHVIAQLGEIKPAEALDEAPDLRSLEEVKTASIDKIAKTLESVMRSQLGTDSPLQINCYRLKAEWAEKLLQNPEHSEAQNHLQAEAEARAITPLELAKLIQNKLNQMQTLASQIEALRSRANSVIAQAQTNQQADQQTQSLIAEITRFAESLGMPAPNTDNSDDSNDDLEQNNA